jgi:hypothetical protein
MPRAHMRRAGQMQLWGYCEAPANHDKWEKAGNRIDMMC